MEKHTKDTCLTANSMAQESSPSLLMMSMVEKNTWGSLKTMPFREVAQFSIRAEISARPLGTKILCKARVRDDANT